MGNFSLSKSIILVYDLIRWKKGFQNENKSISGKFLYQCHPLYTTRVSSYNICIIYLHVMEVCLKVTMFYFCQSKNPSSIMKKVFNTIRFIFSWKKMSLLTNVRNKFVIRKINLYFWRPEKWLNFSFKNLSFSVWSQITF